MLGEGGQHVLHAGSGGAADQLADRAREMARSWSSGVMPSAVRSTMPAATCCLSPATRTWKNSSRLLLKMREELEPLEQRRPGVERLVQHPAVELEPGELAVEVERWVPEVDGRERAGRRSWRVGHGRNVRPARVAERM